MKTEAIVLKSVDYKENSRIVTVFSNDFGIINLIVNGMNIRKSLLFNITTLFCKANFFLKKLNNNFFGFVDGDIIDMHFFIRESLSSIKIAASMAKAILMSQLSEKPSFDLYILFSSYLSKIKDFSTPELLLYSFYLKILKHEGLISFENDSSKIFGEESLSFTVIEKKSIEKLVLAKKFSHLKNIQLTEKLRAEIPFIFKNKMY